MADQVTVSTFLELKDNMSKGLKRLEGLLRGIESAAGGAKAAVDNFNKSAQAAAAGVRLTRAVQDKTEKAARAAQKQQEMAEARHARAMRMAAERSSAYEARKAAKAQREAERDALRRQRDVERMQRIHERMALKQQQIAAKATEFAAKEERKRRNAIEREAMKELRTQERLLEQKRKLEQRASAASAKQARRDSSIVEKLQKQEEAASRRHISQMAATMFGPSVGTAIAAYGTPEFGPLAAIAGVEAVLGTVKKTIQATAELIKDFNVKVFEYGKEYQNLQLRLGMSLQSLNMAPTFKTATAEADNLYTVMRKLARDLPGETKDYMDVFAMGLPKALVAGERDLKRYAEMVSKYTAFAFSRGVIDVGQIGRDLDRIEQGRVLNTTRLFRELSPYINMAGKDFNKLDAPGRLKLLYEAIEKGTQGIEAAADTAEAKLGTLNDLIRQIFEQGGKPLFETQLSVISRINRLLTENHTRIIDIATTVSTQLGDAMEGIIDTTLEWGGKLMDAKDTLVAFIKLADKLSPGSMTSRFLGAVGDVTERGATQRQVREFQRTQEKEMAASEAYAKYPFLQTPPAAAFTGQPALKSYMKEAFEKMPTVFPMEERKKEWTAAMLGQGWAEDVINEVYRGLVEEKPRELKERDLKGTPRDRTKTINDFRFSRFDIKQEFAEGFDPDRIAVAFASDLARLGEFKMQSMNSPAFSGATQ